MSLYVCSKPTWTFHKGIVPVALSNDVGYSGQRIKIKKVILFLKTWKVEVTQYSCLNLVILKMEPTSTAHQCLYIK